MKNKLNFIECDTCRAKPGSPILCHGCLHNRAVIEDLNQKTQEQKILLEQTEQKEGRKQQQFLILISVIAFGFGMVLTGTVAAILSIFFCI